MTMNALLMVYKAADLNIDLRSCAQLQHIATNGKLGSGMNDKLKADKCAEVLLLQLILGSQVFTCGGRAAPASVAHQQCTGLSARPDTAFLSQQP
jgi:hypothetical protein